jgi:hypothetical protein
MATSRGKITRTEGVHRRRDWLFLTATIPFLCSLSLSPWWWGLLGSITEHRRNKEAPKGFLFPGWCDHNVLDSCASWTAWPTNGDNERQSLPWWVPLNSHRHGRSHGWVRSYPGKPTYGPRAQVSSGAAAMGWRERKGGVGRIGFSRPKRDFGLFLFIFLFSFLPFQIQFEFKFNSNFCGSSLQIRFLKLGVLILEIFIYIYYLFFFSISFFFFFSPHFYNFPLGFKF